MIRNLHFSPGGIGLDLYCRNDGAGMPVLLLHGLFGSGNNLGSLARHLQDRYSVLQPDLRNHGRSPRSAIMSYPAMVADIVHCLDQNGIERCAVLGHSMGGKVAMTLALQHGARVAALLVVDICPIDYEANRYDKIFDALEAIPLEKLDSRECADTLLRGAVPDPGMRQFLLSNLYRRQGVFAWRMNIDALRENRAGLAAMPVTEGSFPGPVLFIKGAESDYISDACSRPIQARFPAAGLKVISGAGHWPHAEKPAVFNGLVSRFLQRVFAAGEGTGN